LCGWAVYSFQFSERKALGRLQFTDLSRFFCSHNKIYLHLKLCSFSLFESSYQERRRDRPCDALATAPVKRGPGAKSCFGKPKRDERCWFLSEHYVFSFCYSLFCHPRGRGFFFEQKNRIINHKNRMKTTFNS